MRPDATILLHQHRTPHTLHGFARAASEAVSKLLAFKGSPPNPYIHMGQGPINACPEDENFRIQLQRDLEAHGKSIITVAWGDAQDDWDTLCVCLGADLDGPTIVVFWLGQEAHEQVIAHSKKLMSSDWDGKPETVPGILGEPDRSPN